jgi:hypothetical protein
MFSLVVITLGNVFRVQMDKYGNLSKNSHKMAKEFEKIEGWCSLLVIMLGNSFRVYDGLPNMVIYLHITRK